MKYWWKYTKPYLPYFIIGPICMIVEVIGEVVLPKLLSTVINRGTDGTLTVSLSVGILFAMIGVAVLMMAVSEAPTSGRRPRSTSRPISVRMLIVRSNVIRLLISTSFRRARWSHV